jgi:hypothetical protein
MVRFLKVQPAGITTTWLINLDEIKSIKPTSAGKATLVLKSQQADFRLTVEESYEAIVHALAGMILSA